MFYVNSKVKQNGRNCCVIGCDGQIPKHAFPKDPKMYDIWVKNVNNPSVSNQTQQTVRRIKFYAVCDKHFLEKYKLQGTYKRLTKNAVPTLHLPNGDLEEPTITSETKTPSIFTGKLKEFMENLNRFIEEPSTPKINPQTIPTEDSEIQTEVVYEILDDDISNKTPEITTDPFESIESNKEDTTITDLFPIFTKREFSYKLAKVQNSDLDNLNSLFELVPFTTETNVNYDPTNICRLCLTRTTELVSIFTTNTIDTKEILYSEMIAECASVQIKENDKLPKGICSECIERLNSSYKFRKLCEKSDQNLNEFLNKYENDSNEISNISNFAKVIENVDHIEIVKDETILESPEPILETFENEVDLKNQQSEVFQKKIIKYRCKVCNIHFSRLRLLLTHLKNTHKNWKSYKCGICPKKFNSIEKLNVHMRNHTLPKRFKCTICTKTFRRPCKLKDHLRIHTGEKNFICNICNKAFTIKHGLTSHMKSHSKEIKLYPCEVCGKNLTGPGLLKIHMLTHTRTKIKYVCQICGKVYNNSYYLKVHERVHTGEKPFSCTECGKAFAYRNGLQAHVRSHSNERPYLCTLCGMSFKGSAHLKRHTFSHSTEKQFTCHICLKKFSHDSSLKMHLRTHSSHRFICNYCNKGFYRLDNYKVHVMQVHTGERPHVCHVCGKGFVRPENLRGHLRTHI